jgi:hypothetical protein
VSVVNRVCEKCSIASIVFYEKYNKLYIDARYSHMVSDANVV